MAEGLPTVSQVLPEEAVRNWQNLFTAFAVEARATYHEFRGSLTRDPSKHTGMPVSGALHTFQRSVVPDILNTKTPERLSFHHAL